MTTNRLCAAAVFINLAIIAYAIGRGIIKADDPSRYFGERKFITCLSCLQLLAIAWISFCIFRARRTQMPVAPWGGPFCIWALVAGGFVFLSIDEVGEVHEHFDKYLHEFFRIQETALTDRIDDLVVALYTFAGLCALYAYRGELKQFRCMWPWLAAGFGFGLISILSDTLTNRMDVLSRFASTPRAIPVLKNWFETVEGVAMLFGECCFLVGFLHGAKTAQGLPAHEGCLLD